MIHQGATVSRRGALLAAVASGSLGCRPRNHQAGPAPSAPQGGSGGGWGGLEVVRSGKMRDDQRGGAAIVLLHGWGAPGDDLVPLAQALERPRVRFFVPAAPLPERGGGRAWWHLDASDRPATATEGDRPAGSAPHPALLAARTAVQALLRTIRERHQPDTLVLGGFSQGAMLSLDVALAAEPAVDRVVALSGLLLADSLPGLRAARAARPAVFASHGRQDPVLPFAEGEQARTVLASAGFSVSWHPFDGGHTIPPPVVEALDGFLFGS